MCVGEKNRETRDAVTILFHDWRMHFGDSRKSTSGNSYFDSTRIYPKSTFLRSNPRNLSTNSWNYPKRSASIGGMRLAFQAG